MNYQRVQLNNLIKRVKETRRFIQVIYGPRQVGKTTLVKQLIEKNLITSHYASGDAIFNNEVTWIAEQWNLARIKLSQNVKKELLLIFDEIQKIKNWGELVKKEWDYDTFNNIQIKVMLLGSSRVLLQQGLTESLAGRYETIYIGHWTFSEMKSAFGFNEEEYSWFGSYPGSISLVEDEIRWKQYIRDTLIETSITKDVLLMTRVDKPALMRRLFELGCLYSGQIISFNKIIGQLQDAGNTTTLSHYLTLLDNAGLLAGIERYSKNTLRQRASIPKFQVHNTALISAQNILLFNKIKSQPDRWGRIVESAIGAHLLNYSLTYQFKLFYWRKSNDEVDFVLFNDNKLIGIDVTISSLHRTSGLTEFKKEFNPYKIYLVGKDGIPWKEFININPVELF
ncbi:MAG: ATP-binding protein [Bacteroidetes bacterium]|nr:MAG: ATP-binding protein [Bacteroidota bacterium]